MFDNFSLAVHSKNLEEQFGAFMYNLWYANEWQHICVFNTSSFHPCTLVLKGSIFANETHLIVAHLLFPLHCYVGIYYILYEPSTSTFVRDAFIPACTCRFSQGRNFDLNANGLNTTMMWIIGTLKWAQMFRLIQLIYPRFFVRETPDLLWWYLICEKILEHKDFVAYMSITLFLRIWISVSYARCNLFIGIKKRSWKFRICSLSLLNIFTFERSCNNLYKKYTVL